MTNETKTNENAVACQNSKNAANKKMVDDYLQKWQSKPSAPALAVEQKDGVCSLTTPKDKDIVENRIALLNAFGTTSYDFQSYIAEELLAAICIGDNKKPFSERDINGILAAMQGINPQDEIEGMLASQMVATHLAVLRALKRLKNSDIAIAQDSNGNLANKLMRSFTAQMEALNRHRGKGQQKMTVEHVHVHAGGQAIVGQVSNNKGGGVIEKMEEQPHAR